MKRFRVSLAVLTILTFAIPLTALADKPVDPTHFPELIVPNDTVLLTCESDSVCFQISATDIDTYDTLVLWVGGAIQIEADTIPGNSFIRDLCFQPDTEGVYQITYQLKDIYDQWVYDTTNFTVTFINPPTIEDQAFAEQVCYEITEPRVIPLSYTAPDGQSVNFELISGPGSISSDGVITYTPTGEGETVWQVAIHGECASDTARIADVITINQPPYLLTEDSTIQICGDPYEICFDVIGFDPEGTWTYIDFLEGPGSFQMTSDTSGVSCFTPADVDSAVYMFVYCVSDSCPTDGAARAAWPGCFRDTVNITVLINRPPTITCPTERIFYTCDVDTFCFDVAATDPESDSLTFNILSDNATIDGNTVCVVGGQDAQFTVTVEVVDECGGADTCNVDITINGNREPSVTLPGDTALTLCGPEQVCITGVLVEDPDMDLDTIYANFGTYDSANNSICFDADTTGTYVITLTAVDSCNASAVDTITVDVTITDPPEIDLGLDFAHSFCEPGEVCVSDVVITGGDPQTLFINFGSYDSQAGTICFTPDTSGTYTIIASISDQCERSVADTVSVTVELNEPPTISGFEDQWLYLCYPEKVCLSAVIDDPNNDIDTIFTSFGTYKDGQVCFVPYDSGSYEIVLTVRDTCGLEAVDTAYVHVKTDQGVDLDLPGDTTVFLCQPETLCFPVGNIPADGQISVSGTNVYWNAEDSTVCFFSDCCIENDVTVTVTTKCGSYSETFHVNVQTNSPPLVTLPQDTSFAACDTLDICLPVGISDIDGNIETIDVSGVPGIYYDDYRGTICFQADSTGTYPISVTVTDSCGEARSRATTVRVEINEPPSVSVLPYDSVFVQCVPEEVCIPISVEDVNGNIESIRTSYGQIRTSEDGQQYSVCMLPDSLPTSIDVTVSVADSCGLVDSVTFTVRFDAGDTTAIDCPVVEPAYLCDTATLCLPVAISGYAGDVTASYGEWANGELCFLADTSGTYSIRIISNSGCNADTCDIAVPVEIREPVSVTCGEEPQSLFFCDSPAMLAFPVVVGGDPENITVLPEGAFLQNDTLYFEATEDGSYLFKIVAENYCNIDSCQFTVDVDFNDPPAITASDTLLTLCELPASVAVPFSASSTDDDIVEVRTTLGLVNDSVITIQVDTAGVYAFTITAVDECGDSSWVDVNVTVFEGETVSIDCPTEPISIMMDTPDTLILPFTIDPPTVEVSVSGGGSFDPETQQLVLPIESSGQSSFTVTATAECNTATCDVIINVEEYFPPLVFCPDVMDTVVCLPDSAVEICVPVTTSGNVTNVDVSYGSYLDGELCITVDTLGTYNVRVIASDSINADTCMATIIAREGIPPSVSLPEDFSVSQCDLSEVCVPLVVDTGEYPIDQLVIKGGELRGTEICYAPDSSCVQKIYAIATDSCGNLAVDSVLITITVNRPPIVELPADSSVLVCEPGQEICVDALVEDSNIVSITPSIGVYDAEAGTVCFVPDTSGIYLLTLQAIDDCDVLAADSMYITVDINAGPAVSIAPRDTSIYMCFPSKVCLDVDITDANDNIDTVIVSRGTYKDGQVCFIPYSEGAYKIIVTVIDDCGQSAVDSATVNITTDQGISLECPGDTVIFLCEPDTLCFPIGGIPANAAVSVKGTNVYWNAEDSTVCFYSDCCIENDITVTVTTECGSYSCSFNVQVQTNSKPLVTLPPDTNIVLCESTPLCFPVGVSDIDGNLDTVIVNEPFAYDPGRGRICFTPDTAGQYRIEVTAIDDCDSSRTTDMLVTVRYNSPPTVDIAPVDTTYQFCELSEICVPLTIEDPDDNISAVTPADPNVVYDEEKGILCYTPTGYGEYCFAVEVTDVCGATAVDTACIQIVPGDSVRIACPEAPYDTAALCEPGQVCVPLEVTGTNFAVKADIGSFVDNQVCFDADTSGTYAITVIAQSQCNEDTCEIFVPVDIAVPVAVTCPGDTSVFLCGPDTVCLPFAASASVSLVSADGDAYIDGNNVCVPVLQEGAQTITLTAEGDCGTATCSFTITSDFNEAPIITGLADIDTVVCELTEICVPFDVTDGNENVVSITGPSFGSITETGFCFTPTGYGTYEVIITVADECLAEDVDTATVTITQGGIATIQCPEDPFVSLCGADTVCIPARIEPADADITILPAGFNGYYEGGKICLYVTEGGAFPISVIAESLCGSDTCEFTLNVDMQMPPEITCPEPFDTLLCLAEPTDLCFDVGVTGSGVSVNVNPIGSYSAGQVCLPIDTAGTYDIEIIASGSCGVDTCITMVTVIEDEAPVISLPSSLSVERCPDDADTVCVTGFSVADVESDVTLTKTCGPGEFDPVAGELCFVPDTIGRYEFCFEADDGCQVVTETYTVNVTLKSDCDVCARFSIIPGECVPVNVRHVIKINVETNDRIGGFDLLVSYDATALIFISAWKDDGAIDDWEYFTYSLNDAGCGVSCPNGLVRFVGIADRNNGAIHPPDEAFSPNGDMIFIEFQVVNDQNLGDQFIPIRFVWYECGDNSVSDPTGQFLYVDSRIYNSEGMLIWDEFDDVNYPDSERPFGWGAPDACVAGTDKGQPLRCVEFYHGGLCIIAPEDIDDRGDVNLNNIAYEVGDAVVFTRYFLIGPAAFTISVPGQIAATDVNADGLTLTVADLTYLIRVIIGDAPAIPKVNPYSQALFASVKQQDGEALVQTEAIADIGALHLVYHIDRGVTVGIPELAADASGMDMDYAIEGDIMRVIIYNIGRERIDAGLRDIMTIPYTGDGTVDLTAVEAADYEGRPYTSIIGAPSNVPTEYSLNQNYPNPFNPTTTISFSLPQTGEWRLEIYNIAGHRVRLFEGSGAAGVHDVVWDGLNTSGGQVASGVYLYRLESGSFTQTRKMMLLK